MNPFFTVIIVCLNPGNKLKSTLESVEKQTFHDLEVVIKDGLSTDGSLSYAYVLRDRWEKEKKKGTDGSARRTLKVLQKKDAGIYDAMNQGAEEAAGKYVYYLNCGDRLYSETVLEEMADGISGSENIPGVFYGDIFERLTGQRVASNPRIDAFACYRNVPCHQACFYAGELLSAHPFETRYRVRADYEQFLWCFFGDGSEKGNRSGVKFFYKNIIIADYEGGGFSETKENRKLSAKEHREITGRYMSSRQLLKFRLLLLLTLAPLRAKIAESERTAGIYNRMKSILYKVKGH